MDFKKHLLLAWNLTLKHIVSLIILTLVMLAVSVITLGILMPVIMAGYIHSILMLVRTGREPKVQDLFSQMRLFLPLLAFFFVVLIALMIGFSIFFLPGFIISLAVTFCCIYMIPLMVDRQLNIIDAIKVSYSMALSGNVADHAVLVIIYLGLSMIGSSFILGALFTQPLATLILLSVYDEKISQFFSQPSTETQEPWPTNE
jgi:hypothetical protein